MSTDASLPARPNTGLVSILTFQARGAAMKWAGIAFLTLMVVLGVLISLENDFGLRLFATNWREYDPIINGFSIAMGVALLIFYLNALLAVRESAIAMIGLTLVTFWLFIAVLAPVMDLPDPNLTAQSRTSKRLPMSWRAREVLYIAILVLLSLGALWAALRRGWVGLAFLLALIALILWQIDYPAIPERGDRNAVGDVYHWLGTDDTGRDIFSRIAWGTQRVLLWAVAATVTAYVIGMFFGVAAGYLGGWWDEVISFFANVMLSFPVMVLYILIITYMGGQSGFNVIVAVTFASGPGIMRIVRGLTLDLKTRDYIAAAQTRGESSLYIMLIELLPNARGPLIVDACLRLGYTIIAIATLGFLGLGLPPPDPDWGTMLKDGSGLIARLQQSKLLIPAFSVSSLILGFNLLADGLRDISLRD